MDNEQTDGFTPEPNEALLPDTAETVAQVENEAEATDAETGHDDAGDADGEGQPKPKGIQKRIAEITREKHENARRADRAEVEAEFLREQVQRLTAGKPADTGPAQTPTPDQFDTYDGYIEALTDWKVDQKLAQVEQRKTVQEAASTFEQKKAAAREKYDDFDAVALARDNPITPAMADTITALDNGPDVAYHLGKNRAEATRIAGLSPVMQIAEVARIAERIASPKPATGRNPPPPPPNTVRGTSGGLTKAAYEMSTEEYAEARMNGLYGGL